MKGLKETCLKILREDRSFLIAIFLNFLLGLALFIIGLVTLSPDSAVVKIAYGDIGGYSDGTWIDMLAFPILGFVFSILHSLIAIIIYSRSGKNFARAFLILTMVFSAIAVVILLRLVNEG